MFHPNEHIIITSDQVDESQGKRLRALRKRASTWDAGKPESKSPIPNPHSSRFLHKRQTSTSSQVSLLSQFSSGSRKSFDNHSLPTQRPTTLSPRGTSNDNPLRKQISQPLPGGIEVGGMQSDAVKSWLLQSSPSLRSSTKDSDSNAAATSLHISIPDASLSHPTDYSSMITPKATGGSTGHYNMSRKGTSFMSPDALSPEEQKMHPITEEMNQSLDMTKNDSISPVPTRNNISLHRRGTDGSGSYVSVGSSISNHSSNIHPLRAVDVGAAPTYSLEDGSADDLSYEDDKMEKLEEDRKAPHSLLSDDQSSLDDEDDSRKSGLNFEHAEDGIIDEDNGLVFTPTHQYEIDPDTDMRPGVLTFSRSEMILRNSTKTSKHESKEREQKLGMLGQIWNRICCCCTIGKREISWSRVSTAVVRHAPCFWCCFCVKRPTLFMTDRMTLVRLNILCAFFALWQFGVGIFIIIVTLSEAVADRGVDDYSFHYREALTPNLWMMSGSLLFLSFVGFVLLITLILSIPAIRRVNLVGALRFMWVLHWILPLQIFLCTALFDYHNVTDVWIRHWWHSPSMAWYRRIFCRPGTANDECAVPNLGGRDFISEDEWCFANYQSDECSSIRKAAVDDMTKWCYFFFYGNSIIGCVLCILLLLVSVLLEGIISAPIVQRSRERNIPLWLTLPICGCFLGGLILLKSPQSLVSNQSGSSIYWIGVLYIISGSTFTAAALLGWFISKKTVLNAGDKTQKKIAVYLFITVMVLTIGTVIAIFIASIAYSLDIVNIDLADSMRGRIACLVDVVESCSCCDPDPDNETCQGSTECPEWAPKDVIQIIQTQLKQSGSLAALFAIYALFALRFGFDLKASVSKYEIDYV